MSIRTLLSCFVAAVFAAAPTAASAAPQPLPFTQGWADTSLIKLDDDWSAVAGIVGYRGDGLAPAPGADPRAITADGSSTPIDVMANERNPGALLVGGLAEFELADPVVALQPTSTADAPHLVLSLATTGLGSITVAYDVRDVDGSIDNTVQPVALQYRVGSAGAYANVPAAFVADATTGPRLATKVTHVRAMLPAAAADKPLVELRIMTADAPYSDEWVGIDGISVTGTPLDRAAPALSVSTSARQKLGRALRYGVRASVRTDEAARAHLELRITARLARRLGLPLVVGRSSAALAADATRRITTRFSPAVRRKLARLASFRLTLRTAATDAAGNAARRARTITLVR